MSGALVGCWSCEALGSVFRLGADGTALVDAPSGVMEGRYAVQGNQLAMQDGAGNLSQYMIVSLDGATMHLLDVQGQSLVCTRFDPAACSGGAELARAHGLTLTEGDRAVGLELLRLMLEREATPAEIGELTPPTIRGFESRPLRFLAEMNQLAAALAQVRARTNPAEVGLARQAIFGTLYGALMAQPGAEVPPLMRVILRSIEVLAFDPQHLLVLTDRDVKALVEHAAFLRMLSGEAPDEAVPTVESVTAELVAAFPTMGLEPKQLVCSAALWWRVMDANWRGFDSTQREALETQYREELARQRAEAEAAEAAEPVATEVAATATATSSGSPMNAATWNIMMDMSLQSHATALNIIENIGGTGNYWEVQYS